MKTDAERQRGCVRQVALCIGVGVALLIAGVGSFAVTHLSAQAMGTVLLVVVWVVASVAALLTYDAIQGVKITPQDHEGEEENGN